MKLFIKKVRDHTCEKSHSVFMNHITYRDKIGRLNNHGTTPFMGFECIYDIKCKALILVRLKEIEDHVRDELRK